MKASALLSFQEVTLFDPLSIGNYMIIRQFKEYDKPLILQWLADRDMSSDGWALLPRIGLIVINENGPIAIGFLRRIEGNIALMDSFITNPTTSSDIRNAALNKLGYRLIDTAKRLKFTGMMAFSTDSNTIQRAISKANFKTLPYNLVSLNLSEYPCHQ